MNTEKLSVLQALHDWVCEQHHPEITKVTQHITFYIKGNNRYYTMLLN